VCDSEKKQRKKREQTKTNKRTNAHSNLEKENGASGIEDLPTSFIPLLDMNIYGERKCVVDSEF
jgi:hypothetical protein